MALEMQGTPASCTQLSPWQGPAPLNLSSSCFGGFLGAQGSSRNTLPYQASLFWLLLAGRARPPFILPFMGTSAKKPTQIYDPPTPPCIFPPPVVQPVLYLHKSTYLVCLVMDIIAACNPEQVLNTVLSILHMVVLSLPFYRWEIRGSECLGNLLKTESSRA